MPELTMREPVAAFAAAMEGKLRENDHKGGWDRETIRWLLDRLYDEAFELWKEVGALRPDPERIMREAIDVADYAMMIWDKARKTLEAGS